MRTQRVRPIATWLHLWFNRPMQRISRLDPLAIVDDQRLMREGLRTLLELESDLAIAAEAEDGQAALEQYEATRPAVVLMDIRMPRLDGVEATRRLCKRWPEARVIILTTFDDDAYVFDGLRAGALGYLLKDVSGHELAEAVRKVAAGGALIEPSVARKVLAEFARLAQPGPSGPGPSGPGSPPRAAVRTRTGDLAPAGVRRQQPPDRQPALPGRRHGQELYLNHPG